MLYYCYNKKLCLHYTLTGKRAWYLIEIMYHTNIIQNLQIIAAEGYHLQQSSISPQESPLKLVFTTIALGMDADLRHEVRVIHVGPPKNLEGESIDMYNFHTMK